MESEAVEIWDDEVSPKKWRKVIFDFSQTVDSEVYRALQGCAQVQSKARKTTDNHTEAELKLTEMRKEGWKARIVKVN